MCMVNEMKRRIDELEARLANITEHATHAARCQLIREIEELFRSGEPMTAGQVIDLIGTDNKPVAA